MDRLRRLPQQAPITLAYCSISLLVLVSTWFVPAMKRLALYPRFIEEGHIWQVISYSLYPPTVGNLLRVSLLMLWFGWYIEPELGPRRTVLLYVISAATGGLGYLLLAESPEMPLASGFLLASATGAAFLAWTILNIRTHRKTFVGAWLLALCWLVLGLAGETPLYIVVIHAMLWVTGAATYLFLRTCGARKQGTGEISRER